MTDLIADLAGAANVLLAAPSMGGSRAVCSRLLSEDFDQPNVLFVSYTRSVRDCVDQWAATEEDAATLGVLTVGESSGGEESHADVTGSVATSSDLTGLGIEIGQLLGGWDGDTGICFDSVTSMLQYVDYPTAYEFLHTVTGQFHAAGARAHFHVDPQAHDAAAIDGITSLFDARVDTGEELTVRSRDLVGGRDTGQSDG